MTASTSPVGRPARAPGSSLALASALASALAVALALAGGSRCAAADPEIPPGVAPRFDLRGLEHAVRELVQAARDDDRAKLEQVACLDILGPRYLAHHPEAAPDTPQDPAAPPGDAQRLADFAAAYRGLAVGYLAPLLGADLATLEIAADRVETRGPAAGPPGIVEQVALAGAPGGVRDILVEGIVAVAVPGGSAPLDIPVYRLDDGRWCTDPVSVP